MNASANAPSPVSLAYDPLGRLITKSAASATTFLYAASMLIGEYDKRGEHPLSL
jgi:hypothetical protein